MNRRFQTPERRIPSVPSEKRKRDQQLRMGLAALGGLVVLILAIGLYWVGVAMPNQPVAVVHGREITTKQYQATLLYHRLNISNQVDMLRAQMAQLDPADENTAIIRQIFDQQIQSLEASVATLPEQVLDLMIENELVRQEAERRGITVSAEELEESVQEWFGYDANPDPTPTVAPTTEAEATPEVTQAPEGTATAEPEETAATVVATAKVTVEPEETAEATAEPEETATAEPTAEGTPEPTPTPWPTPTPMTLEGYQSLRADYLTYVHEQTGFDEQAFLNLMESYVLRDKLQEALAAEVPTTAPQVNVRQILLGSQEEADEVLGRLRDGEDFADLARELSQDATKENGGDVGWLPATSTALPTTVVGRAFELEPGERAVVASYLGYHLIEVVEKADDRPLSEMDLEAVRSDALRTWLDTAAADEGVQRMLSEDKLPAGYR